MSTSIETIVLTSDLRPRSAGSRLGDVPVIPTTESMWVGPMPALWHAPAAIVDDDVTYGYVP